jgi:hypothetical protein
VSGDGARFVLESEHINGIQADTIRKLIQKAKGAHTTDIVMRINGQEHRFQADWLKWLQEQQ